MRRLSSKTSLYSAVQSLFFCGGALFLCGLLPSLANAQGQLTLAADMVLDSNALLMPTGGNFSRVINGSAHQSEPLISFGGYQFATWYHNGPNNEQNIYLARRDLATNTWSSFDTGYTMENGDEDGDGTANQRGRWDSHNVIGMGISGDGRIHLAYDHHVDTLRYLTTRGKNKATLSNAAWETQTADAAVAAEQFFVPDGERNSFNGGSSNIRITYPRFAPTPSGDTVLTYRTGGSGNGDIHFLSYNADTSGDPRTITNSNGVLNQQWGDSHLVIDGTPGTYSEPENNNYTSNNRNAYLNGVDASPDGTLHMTWTWRESADGANHGIMYAYSEDGGDIWRNNVGDIVANKATGLSISLNSPDITVADLDLRQSLINQQGQTVDSFGGVHALMYHRRDDGVNGEFDYVDGERFVGSKSAYYHYHRNPITGEWERNQLPTSERVGSRPKIGHDSNGDLYAVYTSTGDLIVAGATKESNYQDWSILYEDTRNFASSPLIDQQRLYDDGVLSVFIQDSGPTSTVATGTSLRVLEFNVNVTAVPEPSGLVLISGAGILALIRRRRGTLS